MPYIDVNAEVWVDLDDFETEDLIEEVKRRRDDKLREIDFGPSPMAMIEDIYMAKHVRKQDYDKLVDELIYRVLGKVV